MNAELFQFAFDNTLIEFSPGTTTARRLEASDSPTITRFLLYNRVLEGFVISRILMGEISCLDLQNLESGEITFHDLFVHD